MKEQFVTYEIALKLKELGFDSSCFSAYTENGKLMDIGDYSNDDKVGELDGHSYYISCLSPLWQQVWSFLDDNGVIIGIIFVDNVFKYTLNIENYVSNEFKDRMSVIKSATEYATNYLWNKKFNK